MVSVGKLEERVAGAAPPRDDIDVQLDLQGIAALVWVVLLVRRWPWLRARLRSPPVSREALKLLDDVEPPTREEIELYVPENWRNLGADWIFTRGKVLTFSETRRTRKVGSVGGFDVAQEFEEEYFLYSGVYGYSDHTGRIHTFAMAATENDHVVRPGRSFIICSIAGGRGCTTCSDRCVFRTR